MKEELLKLLREDAYKQGEFKLSSGRRVDVMGLNPGGRFLLVEIKSSVADFKSDKKWREYSNGWI